MTTAQKWLKTLKALAPTVLLTIAIALAVLLIVRAVIPVEALREANDAVGNFLQTLGTIYAVLMAFVVFVVWSQFNDARVQVEREANNLRDLHRTSRGLADDEQRRLDTHVLAYINHVTTLEWAAMVRRDYQVLDEGWRLLEEMSVAVRRCRTHSEVELAHVGDLFNRINDLSDSRSDRITSSTLHVPLSLWILLYGGAIMTVGSLCLFAVDSLAMHAFLVATLAGAVSHILYLVRDLDDVFSGDFQVSAGPFERVRLLVGASTDTATTSHPPPSLASAAAPQAESPTPAPSTS